MRDAVFFLAAYLAGSVPFGLLIGLYYGTDVRKCGSGNIGATNVTRTVGPRAGKACFLLDMLKGFVPTFLAVRYGGEYTPLLAGAGAILGHMFPVWLGFRGGKGVSTAGGVVLAISPLGVLGAFAVWAAVFFASGYVSLACIVAAAVLPGIIWALNVFAAGAVRPVSPPSLGFVIAAALLTIWKHRSNIRRLLDGTESSFKDGKKAPAPGEGGSEQ